MTIDAVTLYDLALALAHTLYDNSCYLFFALMHYLHLNFENVLIAFRLVGVDLKVLK